MMVETKRYLLTDKLIGTAVDYLPKCAEVTFFSKYVQMDIERMGLMAMLPDSFTGKSHSFSGITHIDTDWVVNLYRRLAQNGGFLYSNIELKWKKPWGDTSGVEEIVMDKSKIIIGLAQGSDIDLNRLPQEAIGFLTQLRGCAEENLSTLDINTGREEAKNQIILGCGPKNEQK